MIRADTVYLVITVLKTKNSYELKIRKPTLAPNQVAYKIHLNLNTEEWFDRITDTSPITIKPPKTTALLFSSPEFGQTTGQKVMNRLTGKT